MASQAAIIIDALRCIAYLSERGVSTAKISLCGHSLGAAVSIVNAAMLRNVVGVAVGAPAVRALPLPPHACMHAGVQGLHACTSRTAAGMPGPGF